MKQRIRTIGLLTVILALTIAGAGASPARAHAAYKDSDPPNRSTVANPPGQVWAEFTEPVQEEPAFQIFDPCGARVDNGDATASGYRVTASMSASAAGTYRVAWRVISTLDGHATSGEFTFTSAGGDACPGEENEKSSPRRLSGGDSDAERAQAPVQDEPEEGAEEPAPAAAGSDKARKNDGGKGGDRGKRPARRDRQRRPVAEPVLAQQDPGPTAAADIPLDWLLLGFGLAAAIGAVGGQIYASIIGPGKKPRR